MTSCFGRGKPHKRMNEGRENRIVEGNNVSILNQVWPLWIYGPPIILQTSWNGNLGERTGRTPKGRGQGGEEAGRDKARNASRAGKEKPASQSYLDTRKGGPIYRAPDNSKPSILGGKRARARTERRLPRAGRRFLSHGNKNTSRNSEIWFELRRLCTHWEHEGQGRRWEEGEAARCLQEIVWEEA